MRLYEYPSSLNCSKQLLRCGRGCVELPLCSPRPCDETLRPGKPMYRKLLNKLVQRGYCYTNQMNLLPGEPSCPETLQLLDQHGSRDPIASIGLQAKASLNVTSPPAPPPQILDPEVECDQIGLMGPDCVAAERPLLFCVATSPTRKSTTYSPTLTSHLMPECDGGFAVPCLLPIVVIWSRPRRSSSSTPALLDERLESCS